MPGIRQRQAADTRSRVIAAARVLFAEQGYFATGTQSIVEAAQVGTRGALYHHFDDKQGLFTAVFEQIETDLTQSVDLDVSGMTGLAVLRHGLQSFLDKSLEAEVRQIILIDGPAVLGWKQWREIEERFGLGSIRNMLRLGADDESIRRVDLDAMSHLLLSLVDEAALYIANADEPKVARAAAGDALGALLDGLQPVDSIARRRPT